MPQVGTLDYALKHKTKTSYQEASTSWKLGAKTELNIAIPPHETARYSFIELEAAYGSMASIETSLCPFKTQLSVTHLTGMPDIIDYFGQSSVIEDCSYTLDTQLYKPLWSPGRG